MTPWQLSWLRTLLPVEVNICIPYIYHLYLVYQVLWPLQDEIVNMMVDHCALSAAYTLVTVTTKTFLPWVN